MEVTNVAEAFQFAIVGICIVMAVLAIVAISISVIMKLEPVLFKEKKAKEIVKAEVAISNSAELDPMALVLITAAVAAQYKAFNIRGIRVGRRRDTAWSELGRSLHQGSHVVR